MDLAQFRADVEFFRQRAPLVETNTPRAIRAAVDELAARHKPAPLPYIGSARDLEVLFDDAPLLVALLLVNRGADPLNGSVPSRV